ncbi:MAG: phage portal protein [Robiginitomaculum sp.]
MKTWFGAAFTRAPQQKSGNTNTPLIALQLRGRCQWTPRTYSTLAREGFQKNAIANRCIRMISEAAASVELCAERSGICHDDDPARKLLQTPSLKMSRAEIFEAHYGYLQLSGNAFLQIALVDGTPSALFALRPDRLRAIVGSDGWPRIWEYDAGSKKHKFSIEPSSGQSLIHHMRLFHPCDDIYGLSPLESAAQAVDIHNAGGLWCKSLLDNSARPSGAIVYTGKNSADRLTDEQFEQLRSEMDYHHSGPAAAGRPLILEGGLDWKPMSMSPADMDFINARREAAREIALAFGVPPMLLGIPGDNTYANYKEANLAFWRQTILPLVRKTADSLGVWLRPWFGDDLRVHAKLDDIPALAFDRSQLWANLKDASFMTDDEKRALAGLPNGGDPS